MASQGSGDPIHVVCPSCAAVNRVPADESAAKAKCGKCHTALFSGKPSPATRETFDRQIGRSDIPVVVDFWAAWCGPCKSMAPIYERVAGAMEPGFRFLKLDTDAEPEIASRYRIQAIPTLMVFKGGKPVAQRAGVMDGRSLEAWLRASAG